MEGKNRIAGLDFLRSIAIILVVITHSSFLFQKFATPNNFHLPDGVDLFFVLSGYLVGTILIKTINEHQRFDFSLAINFLKRRWFRTLPNYFLFLLLNIVLISFGLIKGTINKYLITYFFFFQNFHKPYDFLFWESWSLSIEEWFYLLFPLAMLLLFKVTKMKAKQIILTTILAFILFPFLYRVYQSGHDLNLDLFFRRLVMTRLDAIGYGLLAAYIHWYYPAFWNKTKNVFFVLGLMMVTFLMTGSIKSVFVQETFYFTFTGLSIMLLLPRLESWKAESVPLKPFQFLSKISYSIYLVHIPLLQVISKFIAPEIEGAFLLYGFFWFVTIALSFIIYTTFEKPMMDLRDRE